MGKISIIAALFLSGCISIEMPGVVSDTAKAIKDLYTGEPADKKGTTKGLAAASARRVLDHSYVGNESQTEAEIKELCVKEAAQMLSRLTGKEPSYFVLKNDIVRLNNNAFANCELAIDN
jgi:hypothetical protein